MKNNKGFSLVELIVVIAIMAILAAVAVIGVSVYIPKAQQANDKQLASDVEKALDLAGQAGDLMPGDYVLITLDRAECGSRNGNEEAVDAAMKAAFGENWKDELQLTWDGWDAGPAGNAAAMQDVSNSNFKRDEMDSLLTQVQTVVNSYSDYLIGNDIDVNSPNYKYLQMAGISGGKITADNAQAVGNAAVFGVSEQISGVMADNESKQNFVDAWVEGDFSSVDGIDAVSQMAAQYAMTLAYAKQADKIAGTSYYTDLLTNGVNESAGDANKVMTSMNVVMDEIFTKADSDPAFGASINEYIDQGSATDAKAFLAYMDGVTSSSNSILDSNDLNKQNFFTDGNVLGYVDNYFDASDYLQNAPEGSVVFIYNGTNNIFSAPDFSQN